MFEFLPNNNGVDVFCRRLQAAADGAEIEDAILSFTIYDSSNAPVSGANAVAMPYIGDAINPGHYRGSTPALSLTEGATYSVVVTSSNYPVKWQQYFRAKSRPFGR